MQCNKLCDALYSTILYSTPNYLVINLNRGKGAIYECNVDFPEELNIVDYLTFKSNTTFELYAVICHSGRSSMSGHFVAYIYGIIASINSIYIMMGLLPNVQEKISIKKECLIFYFKKYLKEDLMLLIKKEMEKEI